MLARSMKQKRYNMKTVGMIMWVGRYCQGIVRNDTNVVVERWEFDDNARQGAGEWVRTFRSGDHLALPCGWLVKESENFKLRMHLNAPDLNPKGIKWTILETDFPQ